MTRCRPSGSDQGESTKEGSYSRLMSKCKVVDTTQMSKADAEEAMRRHAAGADPTHPAPPPPPPPQDTQFTKGMRAAAGAATATGGDHGEARAPYTDEELAEVSGDDVAQTDLVSSRLRSNGRPTSSSASTLRSRRRRRTRRRRRPTTRSRAAAAGAA